MTCLCRAPLVTFLQCLEAPSNLAEGSSIEIPLHFGDEFHSLSFFPKMLGGGRA